MFSIAATAIDLSIMTTHPPAASNVVALAQTTDVNTEVEDPIPVIHLGSLPPWWAAAQSGGRRPARAWSEADPTPVPEYDEGDDLEPTQFTDPEPVAEKIMRRRGHRSRTTQKAHKSPTAREKEAAKKHVKRERKAIRLKLAGTSANITRTATTSTAWFIQRQSPWNFRTTGKQRNFIQNEAMVLTNLQKAGVRNLRCCGRTRRSRVGTGVSNSPHVPASGGVWIGLLGRCGTRPIGLCSAAPARG